jgi:hypothetical protein
LVVKAERSARRNKLSNISIKGADTGTGVFTLESPATNTDRVIVLPDEAGTVLTTAGVPASAMPSGSVIQVIQSQIAGSVGTSSTSFVTSGLSASITPTSTSNKVLVLLNGGGQYGGTSGIKNNHTTIYRGGVNLGSGSEISLERLYLNDGTETAVPHSASILDSPNTTSSTTYTAYFKAANGNAIYFNVGGDSGVVTLTLMEIAG